MFKKILLIKIRRIYRHLLSILVIVLLSAGGYCYFFPNLLAAKYYLYKAQELDDASPYGSREAIGYYNKAIEYYEQSGNNGIAASAYIQLGLLHYKFSNIVQVERSVLRAMELGGDSVPPLLKAKAYMLLASASEPERAIGYINQSIAIATGLSQKIMIIRSQYILARIYEYKADFDNAKKTYLSAIEIFEGLSPEDGIYNPKELYIGLAELYEGDGAYENAVAYYQKAITATKNDTKNNESANRYMEIIGNLYKNMEQNTKACEIWTEAKTQYENSVRQAPASLLGNIEKNCPK